MNRLVLFVGLLLLTACAGRQQDAPMLKVGAAAPMFVASDREGNDVELSKMIADGPVVLSFLRSFYCPYCREHLNEITENFEKFESAGVSVVAVSQDDVEDVNEYWQEHQIPFTCIPDENERLKKMYYQQEPGLAPLPAVFVIDRKGVLKLAHYADGMSDIPSAQSLLDAGKSK